MVMHEGLLCTVHTHTIDTRLIKPNVNILGQKVNFLILHLQENIVWDKVCSNYRSVPKI